MNSALRTAGLQNAAGLFPVFYYRKGCLLRYSLIFAFFSIFSHELEGSREWEKSDNPHDQRGNGIRRPADRIASGKRKKEHRPEKEEKRRGRKASRYAVSKGKEAPFDLLCPKDGGKKNASNQSCAEEKAVCAEAAVEERQKA